MDTGIVRRVGTCEGIPVEIHLEFTFAMGLHCLPRWVINIPSKGGFRKPMKPSCIRTWFSWFTRPCRLIHCNQRHCCASRYLLDFLNVNKLASEVSSCDHSIHLDIIIGWKLLVASCVCICVCAWLKLKHVFLSHSSPLPKCSSTAWNMFVSSTKSVRPQHLMHSSLVIIMFVCSVIRIWRWGACRDYHVTSIMNACVCCVKSHSQMGSRDCLIASKRYVDLLFGSWLKRTLKEQKLHVYIQGKRFLKKTYCSS